MSENEFCTVIILNTVYYLHCLRSFFEVQTLEEYSH